MKIKSTKRLPNSIITNKIRGKEGEIINLEPLKEKPLSLLYYLFLKANKPFNSSHFNMCFCTYTELLDLKLLKTTDNTKDNRKAIRKLLNALVEASFISYEVDKDNNLAIEVFIAEPPKERGDYTQIPYSVINNKDIPLIIVPTYVSILHHDYQRGKCNPSVSTLAKYSGCSMRTCHSRLKELQKLQLIQITKSKGGSNKDTNTYYTSNRHLKEDGDFLYRLLDVKNVRFEFKKKNKKKENTSVKSILQERKRQEKCSVGEWK